jgi:hypothetical protein
MKSTRQVIPDAPKNGPKFPCRDCDEVFETSEDFGNHFERFAGSTTIKGCMYSPEHVKKLRAKPVAA